jgi:DNA-binding NarL/FixJ family response regulator
LQRCPDRLRDPRGCAGSAHLRLLLADDHPLIRELLANLLNAQPDMSVVAQCVDGRQAVESTGQLQPDIVIMDLNMPVMDGLAATRIIKRCWPSIKVIGLSMLDAAEGGSSLRGAGADAYVCKSHVSEQLVETILRCAGVSNHSAE